MDIPDNVIRDDDYTQAEQEVTSERDEILKTREEIIEDHATMMPKTISGVIVSKKRP